MDTKIEPIIEPVEQASTADPQITEVGKNNVTVLFPKTMIDTAGTTFQTYDHDDPALKESFGKEGIADRLDKISAQKANWQDEKWVADFVKRQLDRIDQQLTAYNAVQDTLTAQKELDE
jgi:hypothetical protein